MQNSSGDVPLWLWRLIRAAFISVVMLGVVGMLVLSNGAADPQRAGPIAWDNGPLPEIAIPVRSTFTLDHPIDLPAPPFTLEITAQLATNSDPAASWGLEFDSPSFGIMLNGYRFMALLPGDLMPFIHVRGLGEANKITFDADNQNQATWRINDEIAWRGISPALHVARIVVRGGADSTARLTVQRIALFIPPGKPQ